MSVCFTSCDKDDDQNGVSSVPGCTDETAFNYEPNATEDDGSCIAVIEGCTDESAYNYAANANTDDGSCDYSIASQFDGVWNILQLEYEASIDLTPIVSMIDDPIIQAGLALLGNEINLEGEAANAGFFNLNYSDFTYEGNLDFETEEQPFALFQIPSVPIDLQTQGTWMLQNYDQELVFTDSNGIEQVYQIIDLTENTVYMKGVINISSDALDLGGGDMGILELLGSDFELPISIDLYLERVS